MNGVQIPLPPKLLDVFSGVADVRGAYGGRGTMLLRADALFRRLPTQIQGVAGIVFSIEWPAIHRDSPAISKRSQ